MKTKVGFFILTILVLLGANLERKNNIDAFECFIVSSQNVYETGENPEIKVLIKNSTANDIFLIGSLDASEEKWRSPYCYFTIDGQKKVLLSEHKRCGNMNPLRIQDFRLVESGKSFDPYESIDGYGFFDSYEIGKKENFEAIGKYKITFYYSTESTKIEDYLGDGKISTELESLFDKVPKIELTSNTIEIEIVK